MIEPIVANKENSPLEEHMKRDLRKLLAEAEATLRKASTDVQKYRAALDGLEGKPAGDDAIDFIESYLRSRGGKAQESELVRDLIAEGVGADKKERRGGQAAVIKSSITYWVKKGRLRRKTGMIYLA
jgi:hypothetical protein